MNAKGRRSTICTDCGIRKQDLSIVGPELCTVCLEYADHEIMHMDYDDPHAEDAGWIAKDKCMICHPELDHRYTKKQGHTNTVAKSYTSHDGHDHPKTPAARAACRKARRA